MKKKIIKFFNKNELWFVLEEISKCESLKELLLDSYENIQEYLEDEFGIESGIEKISKYINLYFTYFKKDDIYVYSFLNDSSFKIEGAFKFSYILHIGNGDLIYFGSNKNFDRVLNI